ncbi:NMT1/THI5 like protein [uncultured Prevotella sp.]|uniref:ABC transporter substrate-binding protein n=1 Tax=uncultured Prevotella sp. TaxID=159272 RepID=UPI001A4A1721|nr:ABC transporter substrate-binding protein [uncultured Prevotella sp.]VTY03110.1 NMT1/THI5 like protein [uncultured Prevotella sp.]
MCRIKYLLLLTAFIIMGCQVSEKDDSLIEKRKNKVEEVAYQRAFKVGVMPTMDCLPIFLLKDSALYNPDDIDIRLKEYTSQRDCDTAMINGRVQAAVTDLVQAEYLKDEKNAVLDYMTETNATWQLMATPASGIKQVEDLGDKVIGLAFNSVTQYLTIQVISSHSIKNRTYGSQINDIFIRMQMLRNKQLDAVWTSEPQTTQAKILGNKEIYNSTKQDFTPGAIVFVNAPKVEKRQVFEDAYNKAVDMINKHPIQYFAPLIKKYMRVDDKVISALPNMVYKRVTPPRRRDIIKAQNAIM